MFNWRMSMRFLMPLMIMAPIAASAATSPFSTIYTSYTFGPDDTDIAWVTCGSTSQTSGCYRSGYLTGFRKACAMITGHDSFSGDTSTEDVYVVDKPTNPADAVILYDYKKATVVTDTTVTTTFTPVGSASLPIESKGGACLIAANNKYLFVSLFGGHLVAEVKKATLEVTPLNSPAPLMGIFAITPGENGYVSISASDSNVLLGADGSVQGYGGGTNLLLNDKNGIKAPN